MKFEIVKNEEFEKREEEPLESYICDHCGKEIFYKVWDDYYVSIKCPECKELQKVELFGTQGIPDEKIGKEFGKYSYCSHCGELTLNVEGKQYNKLFSDYTEEDFKWHEEISYDPNYILYDKKYEAGEITWEEWCKAYKTFKKTVPTVQQLAERFFICKECGKEKFWQGGYTCPKCDCEEYYFIEMSDSHYSYVKAMEFGGNPQDWTETWMCKCCGEIYEIDNSNC